MSKKIDMTGLKFNRLTAIRVEGKNKHGQVLWLFICDCGNNTIVPGCDVRSGHTKSCGCFAVESRSDIHTKHGHAKNKQFTDAYKAWRSMMLRCKGIGHKNKSNYKNRGISVCDEWLIYSNFYRDMGDPPSHGLSLGRVNNNIGYSKDNCRWENIHQQNNNRRNSIVVEWIGYRITLSQFCKLHNLDYKKMYYLLKTKNMDICKAYQSIKGELA